MARNMPPQGGPADMSPSRKGRPKWLSGRPSEPLVVDAEAGHSHRCRVGHTWYHAGVTGQACPIREHRNTMLGRSASVEDCPLCTGGEDLPLRGSHRHRCPMCEVWWTHERPCVDALMAPCPWCFQWNRTSPPTGMRPGAHHHDCPRCFQRWKHDEPCAAPLRSALADCPVCRASRAELAGQPVDREAASLIFIWSRAIVRRRRGRRQATAAALIALCSGALLALGVTAWDRRSPPDRVLSNPAGLPSGEGSRAVRAALSPVPVPPVPVPDESREPPRIVTRTVPRVTAVSPVDAEVPTTAQRAHDRRAPLQRPIDAPPVEPTPPIEVVAIRFGVIERTPVEWTWSWRLTMHRRGDTSRVSARIEFIEFGGSTARRVGYQEVCGLRLAGDRLGSVEGTHTLSATDSRRVSSVTATVLERCRAAPSGQAR